MSQWATLALLSKLNCITCWFDLPRERQLPNSVASDSLLFHVNSSAVVCNMNLFLFGVRVSSLMVNNRVFDWRNYQRLLPLTCCERKSGKKVGNIVKMY